ncbi:MFS transporter [Acinetobacter bereziniae]|uniref:MFS transporter n=1 Tax=Acinetobacter bereziniae TaxID=106648 RepID=UPI00066597C2|nr:MFS transporter [Acinetobacter bereziniae]MBJ8424697.1 MFS transporter [Acinetobacter bereziniae]MBJ8473849.1 MFS transporter [Acinetobacter bereziniae]
MNKNNTILLAASLANGMSFSMILPLLAPLIRQLKMSELQAGLLVSASALLMSLTAMWISKKTKLQNQYYLLSLGFIGMTITWGLFSGVLSYGLHYSVPAGLLFALLLLSRSSTGIFMAMPQIALQSYVMTRYEEEKQRSQMMAKFGAFNSLGLILGPFLTTLLIVYGILIPMWLAVVILATLSILIVSFYQKNNQNSVEFQENLHQNPTDLANQPLDIDEQYQAKNQNKHTLNKAFIWLILGFSLYIAIVTLNLTAGFYIQDKFKFSIEQSALYFSQCSLIVGIALVAMQVAISKWLKWSLQTLLVAGLSAMLIGLLMSIYTEQIIIFQLAYVFYGIAVASLMPAFTTGASQSVSIHDQTKIAALCTMVQALSLVVAPLLSTALYQFNIIFPYYLLIGIFAVFYVYFIVFKWNREK